MLRARLALAFLCFGLCPHIPGQEPQTRAELIQQMRREKAEQLQPDVPSKLEQRLNKIQEARLVERVIQGASGVHAALGGLATGQGFALGPEYTRRDLRQGNLVFRTSLRGSVQSAWLADLQFTAPRLMDDRIELDFLGEHHHYPQIDYYGPGADSKRASRTSFRRDATIFTGSAAIRPVRFVRLGLDGSYLFLNTGPGTRRGVASIEEAFTGQQVIGLEQQSDYLRSGAFLHIDYRDTPGGPRDGGSYFVRYSYYDDRDLQQHDFRRLELEAQQYFPFFNKRRVIALRARSEMSFTNGDQSVPFYLQPMVGGSDDLRGFRPFRFYDDNSIVVNAEWRWESFSGLDMALFFDAGKVAQKFSQINFHDLEAAYGFGFRFNARNVVFLRLDIGFSHEGFQIWIKFENPF